MEENTQPKGTVGTEALATTTRAQHAGGGGAKAVAHRFSAKMKLSAVQRLLRGESLEAVSRDLNLVAHRLSEWRDRRVSNHARTDATGVPSRGKLVISGKLGA